jgi:hypothetical protein
MKLNDPCESFSREEEYIRCILGSKPIDFTNIKLWDEANMCKLCKWHNKTSHDGITCEKCRDKALGEAMDLGIHIDDYIDGLIVAKELSEDNELPGYKINLTIKKNKGPLAFGITESYTLKYDRDKSNCTYCDAGDEPKLRK